MNKALPVEVDAGLRLITTIEFRGAFTKHLDRQFPNRRAIHSKLGFSLSIDTALASLHLTGSVESNELFTWFDAFDWWLREQKNIN